MKNKIPHTYTLIFAFIVIMAILTYIVPSGEFDRQEVKLNNGKTKTLVVDNSYHQIDKVSVDESGEETDVRVGLKGVLMAPVQGGIAAAEVIIFVLMIGGAFGILQSSGAIEAGLSRTVRLLQGKELLLIPLTMILFGFGGTTIGSSEETIPFYMVFIPLMLSLGYDSLTGFMMIFLGAASGVAASTTNPFAVGIAQAIAELAPNSNVDYRWVQFAIFMAASIGFVMLYARRVKKNPEKSPMYELDKQNKEYFLKNKSDADKLEFKWHHSVILIGFLFGIILMVYGVKNWDWYISEIAMVFIGIGLWTGIVSAIAGTMGQKEIAESFVQGCKDLTYSAVIIALARGILVIAQDGKIIDTILNSTAGALSGLPKAAFGGLMLLIQNIIAFLVPSSSGHAALTMPVMGPLVDLMKINRDVAVTAYQYGTGLTNIITPTSGTLMAALGIARIPWNKWAKFILPFFAVLWILAFIFIVIGMNILPA